MVGKSSQQQQQRQQEVRPPRVGMLLLLRPWLYERAFWSSFMYKRVASDMDLVNLCVRCLEVYLVLFRSWVQVADDALTVIQGVFCNTVLLVLLHVALRVLMPSVYTRWRWLLVVHMRLYNLLSGIAILRELRGLLTRAPPSPLLDYLAALPTHPAPRLATARALAMALLTFRALGQSLPPLVPLPLNAAIQISFLLAVVRYMSSPIATHFSQPDHGPHVQHLCRTIAAWVAPPPAAPLHDVCATPQSAWVLSLFLPLFGGLGLPLYLAYISEHTLKHRFLASLTPTPTPRTHPPSLPPTPTPTAECRSLQDPRHPPQDAAPKPTPSHFQVLGPFSGLWVTFSHCRCSQLLQCAKHALLIWLLAVLCWAAAVSSRALAARHLVKPLAAAPRNQVWYWQLVCGQDEPCCPAL